MTGGVQNSKETIFIPASFEAAGGGKDAAALVAGR